MRSARRRPEGSSLHLQLGQETIYLLLTGGLFVAFVLALYVASLRGQEKQPPIITLTEAAGYTFPTGSAEVSAGFRAALRRFAPKLKQQSDTYHAPIIEVIGHTDEQPIGKARTDLDRTLIAWLRGDGRSPVAGDNVGLGMARAAAVARELRRFGLSDAYTIIPLSAGPLVKKGDVVTDGLHAADDQGRRRIELRLRRRSG